MPGGGGDDSPGAPHPSPVAVERVESLLHTMESHLTDGTKVSPTEVAERLGMTTALAQSCIDVLDPGG